MTVVIADKAGRLGNRLLVFAHVAAAAIEHGFTVFNPSFDEYAEHFPSLKSDALSRFPPARSLLPPTKPVRRMLFWLARAAARLIARVRGEPFGVELIRIPVEQRYDLSHVQFLEHERRARVVLLQGWRFRADECLEKHRSTVREFFAPQAETMGRVEMLVAGARSDCDVLVGVHLRQHDYRIHLGGRFYFEPEQYAKVMTQIEDLVSDKRVGFLVCSDDPRVFEGLASYRVTRGSGYDIEDLYALAACDLIVGPPSSYTLWASFYGGTPLYTLVERDAAPTLDNFSIYPDIRFQQVRDLY